MSGGKNRPRWVIGSVPYLNAKPLVAWLHSPECTQNVEVVYEVPSMLARGLREGRLDVAMVSTFELFCNRDLALVPDVSVSADGPVKSVRLFSQVPFEHIKSVALDTSSLTSTALTRIVLTELYGINPDYMRHAPDLSAMLSACDAGLIIGDLQLFDTPARYILDLGEAWKRLTGLPFVYAAWLARKETASDELNRLLLTARQWGDQRLDELSVDWSRKMELQLDRVRDYFINVMKYDLDQPKLRALEEYHRRCEQHGIIPPGTAVG